MIAKAVFIFLIAIVVLAIFGKLRFPSAPRRCRACGRPVIGSGRCPCGKDKS